MLARNIARYLSDASFPSQIFSMSELVPAIIWSKLFSSLVAFETGSGVVSRHLLPFDSFSISALGSSLGTCLDEKNNLAETNRTSEQSLSLVSGDKIDNFSSKSPFANRPNLAIVLVPLL